VPHGRVPPHNIDAETSLLGGVLLDREAPLKELLTGCSASDFYRDAHRKIAEAMASLLEDGIPVDRISVSNRLDGARRPRGGRRRRVPRAARERASGRIEPRLLREDRPRQGARKRRLIEAATAIVQLGYEQHGDTGDLIIEADRRFRGAIGEAPRVNRFLGAHTKFTVDELTTDPEPLSFILWPYIQAETVSVLSGGGASGKTALLMQLATARALHRPMFQRLTASAGETVIFTTEDRRVHYRHKLAAVREHLGLEFDAREVASKIHIIDMAGTPVRLIAAERGEQFMPTSDVDAIAEALKSKAPNADLVIIETISRVTGGIESNPAMTVLVNACERLCVLAKVAVILVGHVGQNTARAGLADAYSARGGSALGDNGRSSMSLTPLNSKNKGAYAPGLELSDDELSRTLAWVHTKSNGAPAAEPRLLRKLGTKFGMLLVDADFSDAQRKPPAPAKKKARGMTFDELKSAIVEYVEDQKTPRSVRAIRADVGGRSENVSNAVKELLKEGRLQSTNPADKDAPLVLGTITEPANGTTPDSGGSRPPVPPTVLPSGGTEGGGENQLPLLPGSSDEIGNQWNRSRDGNQ
jgi:hypothetical protein